MLTAFLKNNLRKAFLDKRVTLPDHRKKEAAALLLKASREFIEKKIPVLSFASFGSEIDLWPLNLELAQNKLLLLPKVSGETLEVYAVFDLQKELVRSSLGMLEPNPELCSKWDQKIEIVLVPGVAFDEKKHRLGYGKGFYDQFLKTIPSALKIGTGFQEQFAPSLPTHEHDQPVDRLYLF